MYSLGVVFYNLLTGDSPWKKINGIEKNLLEQNMKSEIDLKITNKHLWGVHENMRDILEMT